MQHIFTPNCLVLLLCYGCWQRFGCFLVFLIFLGGGRGGVSILMDNLVGSVDFIRKNPVANCWVFYCLDSISVMLSFTLESFRVVWLKHISLDVLHIYGSIGSHRVSHDTPLYKYFPALRRLLSAKAICLCCGAKSCTCFTCSTMDNLHFIPKALMCLMCMMERWSPRL